MIVFQRGLKQDRDKKKKIRVYRILMYRRYEDLWYVVRSTTNKGLKYRMVISIHFFTPAAFE